MTASTHNFQVNPSDLFQTQVATKERPSLDEGEILFKVSSFAFTSNNITYAVVGDRLGYWKFFPTKEPWGIIPAWGFGEVVESKTPGVVVGEKCYGYFPMGNFFKNYSHPSIACGFFLTQLPTDQSCRPFTITTSERIKIRAFPWNGNPIFPSSVPFLQPPFLNYYFLQENDFFSAKNLILTSASSKTALGLAFMMSEKKQDHILNIIGLTSPSNVEFVTNTGFYDEVIAYDHVRNELSYEDSLVVDLAGNGRLLSLIHEALDEKLLYISRIGLADWQTGTQGFKHPQSHFFLCSYSSPKTVQRMGRRKSKCSHCRRHESNSSTKPKTGYLLSTSTALKPWKNCTSRC